MCSFVICKLYLSAVHRSYIYIYVKYMYPSYSVCSASPVSLFFSSIFSFSPLPVIRGENDTHVPFPKKETREKVCRVDPCWVVGGGDITKRIKSRATEDFEEKKKWQLDEREREEEKLLI